MAADVVRKKEGDRVVALVGNPNVGKSSLFNELTGCRQHTGNWPGKTVAVAQGSYGYKGQTYLLVDLPGTYSLRAQSEEERLTTEFLLSGEADCALVLCDGTNLERTLNLALQVMQLTDKVVVGVNLMDEAAGTGIEIDANVLERQLGIPVNPLAAKTGQGILQLQERIRNVVDGFVPLHPIRVFADDEDILSDRRQKRSDEISEGFVRHAEGLAAMAMGRPQAPRPQKLDRIALGRWSGPLVMVALLLLVFWLTIVGANYPSQGLHWLFARLEQVLRRWTSHWPAFLTGLLLDGIYGTTANVVAVMLPPMAIFFPLFTLMEDFGYLPRAAFLLDHSFEQCGACGKQGLTMCMGFGCNAAGVVGCRIISSDRERLIAVLTNAFVPCNGRFPTLLALIACFFTRNSLLSSLLLTLFVLLSIAMTFFVSFLLHKTVLPGEPAQMVLEMPPYRRPRLLQVLTRSVLDRTIYVLGRAAAVAAPAGALIWLLGRISVGETGLMPYLAGILDPVGVFFGMNGVILLGFFLSFPANELLRLCLSIAQAEGLSRMGWSGRTALCVILFLLFHWPCGATCLTIRRETGAWKWVLLAMALPTLIGAILCAAAGHLL